MDAISPLCTGKLFYFQHHPWCGEERAIFLNICGHDTHCLARDFFFREPLINAKFISDSPGKSNMLKLKDTHLQVFCYRCRKNILCPYLNAQTQAVIIVKSKDIWPVFAKQLLDKQQILWKMKNKFLRMLLAVIYTISFLSLSLL